jgi:DNA-binding protein H-NS
MSAITDVAPQLRRALEGSLAALRRSAESELPAPVAQRMHQLGEHKDTLADAEREEYLALISFWKSRTLEKAEAAVALQRLREAAPDLVATP